MSQSWQDAITVVTDAITYRDGQIVELDSENEGLTAQVELLTARSNDLATQVDGLTQSNQHLALLLADDSGTIAQLNGLVAGLSPDVTVTYGTALPRVSALSTAVSHVATGDLMLGDAAARARAEAALTPALTFHRLSAHSYGGGDPWPVSTSPEPTNWSNIDSMLAMVARMGGTPIMGFGNWPWHVKGKWNGLSTTPLTAAEALSDDGRPLTDKMPTLLKFVQRTCERYMVAPYNVRFWQLGAWEFHGFELGRNGTYSSWAYDAYPGTPGQADMGMAYLHNQVSAKILSVAASLGIDRSAIKIITNYPPMVAYGVASPQTFPVGHPLYGKPYGAFDKRTVQALLGMLPLLTPGSWDYWSYDQTSRNKDGVVKTDDWTNTQRFTDMGQYLVDQVAWLGYGSKPFIVSELYNKPQVDPGPNSFQLRAALQADALRRILLLGASQAITWSTVGRANDPGVVADAGLHSAVVSSTGGQPQPALSVIKLFRDYFPPGTPVYDAQVSGSGVSGLMSSKVALLINQTPASRKVSMAGDMYVLDPHEVRPVML